MRYFKNLKQALGGIIKLPMELDSQYINFGPMVCMPAHLNKLYIYIYSG